MTCNGILDQNEARVIRDIGLLIVPSTEGLFSGGAAQLKGLAELVHQRWMCSIQLMSGDAKMKLPHPDFTAGLHWSIFTDNQMKKLDSIAGGDGFRSRMKATESIYFPFLICEVKCGIAANRIGDRQNVYSAAVACKGMVELYQTVGRERELNRQILVFSVGHDEQSVRLYGHYVYFEDTKIVFYRHHINSFYFTALDGREKWTGYQFTRNVYDIFSPIHLKRVCSVLDELPESYPPPLVTQSPSTHGHNMDSQENHRYRGRRSHESRQRSQRSRRKEKLAKSRRQNALKRVPKNFTPTTMGRLTLHLNHRNQGTRGRELVVIRMGAIPPQPIVETIFFPWLSEWLGRTTCCVGSSVTVGFR
jgi:hypothetical protein